MTGCCLLSAPGRHRLLYAAALLVGFLGQLLLFVTLGDRQLFHTGDVKVVTLTTTLEPALDNTPPHLIVIVASSPRSGSSLLGELLTAASQAAYFFEPFYYHVSRNISTSSLSDDEITSLLTQLLTCQLTRVHVMREARYRRFIWKSGLVNPRVPLSAVSMAKRCNASSTRVVKLVRPRLSSVLKLLDDPRLGPHMRIVHLVRDPRGVVNSQLNNTKVWRNVLRNPAVSCTRLHEDLVAARNVTDQRFRRLHYEDLAVSPRKAASRLVRDLGLPETRSLTVYLDRHWIQTKPAPAPPVSSSKMSYAQARRTREEARRLSLRNKLSKTYFGTVRDSTFDPFHWRRELKPEVRQLIEKECSDVLKEIAKDKFRKVVVT